MFRLNSWRPLLTAAALLTTGLTATPTQAAGLDSVGFNGSASGFPTGAVTLTGGGSYDPISGLVHSAGGFSCTQDVRQGPLSISINPDDQGPCLAGEGVRWDTVKLLQSTTFKCTGSPAEAPKKAVTGDHTLVLQADFYRAGDGNDESFTAQMIISAADIAPNDFPGANLWVQGVGCGPAVANFN
jgi:hypothetical protein